MASPCPTSKKASLKEELKTTSFQRTPAVNTAPSNKTITRVILIAIQTPPSKLSERLPYHCDDSSFHKRNDVFPAA